MQKSRFETLKILIAEDEYLVSEDIIRGLKNLGYTEFLTSSNGREAIEVTCREEPDLVLMDIQMPELDGLKATKEIQECCPTPVIILTAYESEELVARAGKAGASAYLTKPPKPREIERAITIAISRHADLMEMRRLNEELTEALHRIKKLEGILPICSSCKEIRDENGAWHQIELYIRDHSEADFSHGICPKCIKELYPEEYEMMLKEKKK